MQKLNKSCGFNNWLTFTWCVSIYAFLMFSTMMPYAVHNPQGCFFNELIHYTTLKIWSMSVKHFTMQDRTTAFLYKLVLFC